MTRTSRLADPWDGSFAKFHRPSRSLFQSRSPHPEELSVTPWTEQARRILRQAELGDPETSPRARLLDALWDENPDGWMHVLVGGEDVTELLITARTYYMSIPLVHVSKAAELVARAYGREQVDAGCLAIGLAVTARGLGEADIQRISADVGFGHLDRFEEMSRWLHGELLDNVYDAVDTAQTGRSPADPRSPLGVLRRGLIYDKLCTALSLSLRVGFAASVAWTAWVGPTWLFLVAPLILVSTRPLTSFEWSAFSPIMILTIPTKFPWLPALAVMCAGFGQVGVAVQVLVCAIAVRALAHLADHLVGRNSRFDRAEVPDLPMSLQSLPSLWTSGLTIPRFEQLGAMAVVALIGAGLAKATEASEISTAAVAACVCSVWASRGGALAETATTCFLALVWLLPGTTLLDLCLGVAVGASGAALARKVTSPRPLMLVRPRPFTADRRLALAVADGHAGAVLDRIVGEGRRPESRIRSLIAAWAALELGRPGTGRRLIREAPGAEETLAGRYISLRAASILGDPVPAMGRVSVGRGLLSRLVALEELKAQYRSTHRDGVEVALAMADLIPRFQGRNSLPVASMIGIEVAKVLTPLSPKAAQGVCLRSTLGVIQALHADLAPIEIAKVQDHLQSRDGSLWTIAYEGTATMLVADTGGYLVESTSDLAIMSGDGKWGRTFAHFLDPLKNAEYSQAIALAFERTSGGVTDESLEHWIQSLAAYNVARHRLSDPEDRAIWWSRFSMTLELALDRAEQRRDWRALAEILEVARFQLADPQSPPSDEVCISLAVRGRSRFAEAHYPVGDSPGIEDFETVILRAVGEGGYWWSTWATESYLYWALVPQRDSEPVIGGRLTPTEWRSEVHQELFDWLPVLKPGERLSEMQRRVTASPLFRAPSAAERTVANAWGSVLPPRLRDGLSTSRVGMPTRIGAALCPELAPIPWAWVLVGSHRLVEVADFVLVPPASLVRRTAGTRGTKPVRTAVLNPAGNLPDVESLASMFGPEVQVLQGKSDEDPRARFAKAVSASASESTLYIACHTARSDDGSLGLQVGLGESGLLTFAGLARRDSDIRLPEQVLAMACESSDLGAAARGEWSVLGAGLIAAGAQRAVVTAYLHPGLLKVDAALIAAVDSEESLSRALRRVQLQMLQHWSHGTAGSAPIFWAGLQIFGMVGEPAATHVDRRRWVEQSVLSMLDDAAHYYSDEGADELTVDAVVRCMRFYGYDEVMTLLPRLRLNARNWIDLLRLMRREARSHGDPRPLRISDELMETIVEACALTRSVGWRVLEPEALFISALKRNTPESLRLQRIAGWRPDSPNFVESMLELDDDGWHNTGFEKTPHLLPGETDRVYEAFGSTPPVGEDRWYHKDRVD